MSDTPDTPDTPDDVDTRHPVKPKQAREQATEYLGFMGSLIYDLGGGEVWELPNPSLLPPDMKMRYLEHLRFLAEDLDTKPRKNPVTGETDQIQMFPPRKDGKLINDEELLCLALMGSEDVYAKFLAAGGVPGQIATAWQVMGRQLQERALRDSKSL